MQRWINLLNSQQVETQLAAHAELRDTQGLPHHVTRLLVWEVKNGSDELQSRIDRDKHDAANALKRLAPRLGPALAGALVPELLQITSEAPPEVAATCLEILAICAERHPSVLRDDAYKNVLCQLLWDHPRVSTEMQAFAAQAIHNADQDLYVKILKDTTTMGRAPEWARNSLVHRARQPDAPDWVTEWVKACIPEIEESATIDPAAPSPQAAADSASAGAAYGEVWDERGPPPPLEED